MNRRDYHRAYYHRTIERRRRLSRTRKLERARAAGVSPRRVGRDPIKARLKNKRAYLRRTCGQLSLDLRLL